MKNTTTRQDKRGRVLRTTDERQELVGAFKASRLGMAEFCRQRELRLSTFCQWVNSGKYGRRKVRGWKRKAPMKFAQVQVAMGGTAPIEVELAGGVRIRVRDAGLWPMVGGWIREVTGC